MSDDGAGQSESRSPLLRTWDIVRYAPIGILLDGPSRLPEFAERGKAHVRTARVLGELAVHEGSRQFRSWLDGSAQPGAPSSASEGSAAGPVAGEAAPPRGADLPIAGYEDLAAADIVARLTELSGEELEAVRAYEVAHRNRKTVLNKVARLSS